MKKVLDWLGWILVLFTILSLIFTWLTTYQFTYRLQRYFNNYYILQMCMLFTMLVWGIKFFDFKAKYRNLVYTLLCILIAAGSLFFMYAGVY